MKAPDDLSKRIDGLLVEIKTKKTAIAFMQRCMTAEIERVTGNFKPFIKTAEDDLGAIEAELVGLMKFNKAKLFTGRDRVDFKNGAILRQIARRVKRIKGMLARLKATGRTDAIKVVESVDWDTIEQWDDAILQALGTKRVPKESFEYEVKE